MVSGIRILAVLVVVSGGSALGQTMPVQGYPQPVWPPQAATRPKVVAPPSPVQASYSYPVQRPVQQPQQYPVQRPVQQSYQYPVQTHVPVAQRPQVYAQPPVQQQSEVYDHSYGATRPYATYSIVKRGAQKQRRTQGGFVGELYETGADIGSHIWSYMPAPVRGEAPLNYVPPGSGVVSEVYVPGTP